MKYTKEKLQIAVDNCTSIMGVLSYFGLKHSGGSHKYIKDRIKHFGIDTSHFLGQASNRGTSPRNKLYWTEVLVKDRKKYKTNSAILRRALLESGMTYQCRKCNIKDWQGQEITLEVNHINQDSLDNRRENLEFLCPNCHSQYHMPG